MERMVNFSSEDVIFLLNKWDTISHEGIHKQEQFFEETKTFLHKLWGELDDSCIFRISAHKVLTFFLGNAYLCCEKFVIFNAVTIAGQESHSFISFSLLTPT